MNHCTSHNPVIFPMKRIEPIQQIDEVTAGIVDQSGEFERLLYGRISLAIVTVQSHVKS